MSPKDRDAGFGWPHHFWHGAEGQLDPIARMEWLDDLMFAAIDGDPVALDCAADAWQKTRDELGQATRLRNRGSNTCGVPKRCGTRLRSEPNHPPHKVFAAIEIISLLAAKGR